MKRICAVMVLVCLVVTMFAFMTSASAQERRVPYTMQCTASAVNFRKEPSLDGEVIGVFVRGDRFITTYEPDEVWLFGCPHPSTHIFSYYGYYIYGYVAGEYFEVVS